MKEDPKKGTMNSVSIRPATPEHTPALSRKDRKQLFVVHSVLRTPAAQRILREVTNPRLTPFEREYLEWYHGDPLKRSVKKAHDHAVNHRAELRASKHCGCFHCGEVFRPTEITEWMKDSTDHTAFCPHCDIDAVIGDASGYPLTEEFLSAMRLRWYGEE